MPGRYDKGVSSTKLAIPEICCKGDAAVALALWGKSAGIFIMYLFGDRGGDISNISSSSFEFEWLVWGMVNGRVFSENVVAAAVAAVGVNMGRDSVEVCFGFGFMFKIGVAVGVKLTGTGFMLTGMAVGGFSTAVLGRIGRIAWVDVGC